ncbi:MAG: DUF4038 domain-containing protein [Kiritimatiellae bacterium]|nr:DUF4038 domain-containing protein [Kiritimatiellia bacterium]
MATTTTFEQSCDTVDAYDFVEITVRPNKIPVGNPFTELTLTGEFGPEGADPVRVEGFCDAPDGAVCRIRFMPTRPGKHAYTVEFTQAGTTERHAGTFKAKDARRKGVVRVDPDYPYHFIWSGTGEHYFWNATTTYWLMGWDLENIKKNIDRLADLRVNRLRVAIAGRVASGQDWCERVYNTERFSFLLNPWVAERPDSLQEPGFDPARFNVAYWQKFDALLRHARERDVIVSVVFYVDGRKPGVEPFGKDGMGGADEQRYYRYAAARFSAFSNVMWDVSNEYRQFRTDWWAETLGAFLKARDPYKHVMSVHGHNDFRFRTSPWADFAMFQKWDEEGGYKFMFDNRKEQAETGRPMPQVNEEYGYEDHYPMGWGGNRRPPSRSADNRRRVAWSIYMAGGYQTNGETAMRGTGWGPDTGGGWINGRGDDSMGMFPKFGYIMDFFTSFEWWKCEPRPDLTGRRAVCLAEPGRQYAVYAFAGDAERVTLEPGTYDARQFNPRTGEWTELGTVEGAEWTTPETAELDDCAWVLRRT